MGGDEEENAAMIEHDIEMREESARLREERQYHALTKDEFQRRLDDLQRNTETNLLNLAPTASQRLGFWTVYLLIMNRTIGAGIFAQPVTVLRHAGSSGAAILLWIAAGLIVYAIMVCWLELGMSVPFYDVLHHGQWIRQSTPRSGGDKNYLEYIYKKPALLATCVFGITFLVFSNLAGNAIQFGMYIEMARHSDCIDDTCFNKSAIIGWALGVLTVSAAINVCTRKYSIQLNNAFGILKIIFVLFIVFAGFGHSSRNGNGCRNLNLVAHPPGSTFGDVMLALVHAVYPYSGFEQPFYVLAEVEHPRRIFSKATNWALLTLLILFPLTNVSFLCIIPYTDTATLPSNMTVAFFHHISSSLDDRVATRIVTIILAFFIFGNIVAQTFTASRVKQEIAKEGILPWSLIFAKGSDTLASKLFTPRNRGFEDHREQSPLAATGLHWIAAVVLVLLVGIPLRPSVAYGLLTFLKSLTIIGALGLLTVAGLLYLKIDAWLGWGRGWDRKRRWYPWLDPLPAIVATLGLAFLLVAVFVPPKAGEPRRSEDGDGSTSLPYWVGPMVGWAAPLVGVAWWLGLLFVQWRGRWRLEVTRTPYIEVDSAGEFVQMAEIVEHERVYHRRK